MHANKYRIGLNNNNSIIIIIILIYLKLELFLGATFYIAHDPSNH
jgi:hypothetical protein